MEDLIILNSPLLLICYLIALALCWIDVKKRASGYVFTIISLLIFVLTTTYALLKGASLYETGTVAVIFLIFNLSSYGDTRGDKK